MPIHGRAVGIKKVASPHWEMGSFFHWGIPKAVMLTQACRLWGRGDEDYLVSSGRDALEAIAGVTGKRWLIPEYYCPDVTAHLQNSCGVTVTTYPALPTDCAPRYVDASGHDVLLQSNLFGRWNPPSFVGDPTIVDDHTHSDLSAMSTPPPDGFSFSSFRKSLPVPDGAWLRLGERTLRRDGPLLLEEARGHPPSKISAMIAKSIYMSTGQPQLKSAYLRKVAAHETELADPGVRTVAPETEWILDQLDVESIGVRRRENFVFTESLLQSRGLRDLMQIEYRALETPFSLVLTFPDRPLRDRVRRHLIENRIYPALLWDFPEDSDGVSLEALSFSGRSLSLPVDYRYRESDLARAVGMIEQALCEG